MDILWVTTVKWGDNPLYGSYHLLEVPTGRAHSARKDQRVPIELQDLMFIKIGGLGE